MTALPLDAIQVTGRHRRDLGDIASLAESMTEIGLLHPVVVTPEHRLVAGQRRLAAARSLGWTEIDATVVTNLTGAAALLRAESDENTHRKDFTPTEAATIAKAREELLRPLAHERKRVHGQTAPGRNTSANFAEARPRQTAALGTGYSHESIRKVRRVQELAESPSAPEPVRAAARKALTEMDATGRVDGPYRDVVETEQREAEATLQDVIGKRLPRAAADIAAKRQRARWSRLISAAAEINTMSPETVAAVLSDGEFAAAPVDGRGAAGAERDQRTQRLQRHQVGARDDDATVPAPAGAAVARCGVRGAGHRPGHARAQRDVVMSSGAETRTRNPAVNSRTLCQLSYPGWPGQHTPSPSARIAFFGDPTDLATTGNTPAERRRAAPSGTCRG